MPGFMMVVLAHVAGDVGGSGLARYHISRMDGTLPTAADATSAGNALHAWYGAFATFSPAAVTISVDPLVEIIDPDSAVPVSSVTMSPALGGVNGLQSGVYAAGVGARANWHTTTILNRRRVRGATLLIPLHSSAFLTNGAVAGSTASTILSAASTLLASLSTAQLQLVIWHRPLKGATSGGLEAPVVGCQVGATPAGLRSRRS